jgi:hypothetical protein
MKKPNLFIVGAARSGTTSLWQYLKSNPGVFMPEDELFKEPTFFSDSGKKRGLDEYLAFFKQAKDTHKWIGEASVAYLTDPESAEKIYAFDPAAKIIIMLRNPADRAYSLYNWMIQDGYEYASSFEEALRLEKSRIEQKESDWYKPNYYWGYLYYRSGIYHEQVKKYLELFKQNVFIIKFEDFAADPEFSYRDVCAFLQIDPAPVSFNVHNPSHVARSARLLFVLRKLNNYIIARSRQGVPAAKIVDGLNMKHREIVDKLTRVTRLSLYEKILGKLILKKIGVHLKSLPDQFLYKDVSKKEDRDRLLRFGLKPGKPAKLKEKTRRFLLAKYEADITRLSALTGMDFSRWLIRT